MSYGKVHEEYWDGEKIEPLSDRAALLGLYLITGPHRNAIGCFKLGTGAIMDLERFRAWGIEGVSKALQEMVDTGFIVRDERTGWTLIPNAISKDPINSGNVAIHAVALAGRIPKNSIVYKAIFEKLSAQLKGFDKHLNNKPGYPLPSPFEAHSDGLFEAPSEGLTKPHRTPNLTEPIPEPEPQPAHARETEASEPPKDGGGGKQASLEAGKQTADVERIVGHFLTERERLWPDTPNLPSPRLTLEAQAGEYLAAKAPAELVVEVVTREMAKQRDRGQSRPPSNLRFCCASVETATINHLTAIQAGSRRNGVGKTAGEPTGPLIETDRAKWLREAVRKLAAAGVVCPTEELTAHAEDDAWLQARIAEKTDLTKRPECMARTAVNDRMDA